MKLYELFATVLVGVVIPSIKTWHGNNKILKELDSVRSEVNAVKVIGEKTIMVLKRRNDIDCFKI